MNFNTVSTLLAVSSAHDTVHIFKLGRGKEGSGSGNGKLSSPSPSSDSVDTVEGGVDGGYEAFIEKKKNGGGVSSSLRRRSMQVTKTLSHSMGGYLPNTLTEMWEPSRDFAFLRLPTSGARCAVALSGCVKTSLTMLPLVDPSIHSTMPQVMVISSEGYFYSYNIDLENGGECSLMKQYR